MKVTTLKQLATAINAIGDGHVAVTEKSWTSTDQKPRGVRWRLPGKGRNGTRLLVKDAQGVVVLHCDTSQTTPVEIAITRALDIFGSKLDLDPGKLYAIRQYVRVIMYGPFYGTILAVKMKNKSQAEHYEIKLRNDHITTVEPWRIRPQ